MNSAPRSNLLNVGFFLGEPLLTRPAGLAIHAFAFHI